MTTPVNPSDLTKVTVRRAAAIRSERLAVLVLFVCLIATASYARFERRRADAWQADIMLLQSQRDASVPRLDLTSSPSADYYPVTLVRNDGSRTRLDGGIGLQMDLTGGAILDVDLKREQAGRIMMWAPSKRGDSHFHCLVFRPHCCNVATLELERHESSSDVADDVSDWQPF